MVHARRLLLHEVGMNNLGTSSHLNAAVQCLRHALPLTKYFLEARHVPDINATNCLVLQVRGEASDCLGTVALPPVLASVARHRRAHWHRDLTRA